MFYLIWLIIWPVGEAKHIGQVSTLELAKWVKNQSNLNNWRIGEVVITCYKNGPKY